MFFAHGKNTYRIKATMFGIILLLNSQADIKTSPDATQAARVHKQIHALLLTTGTCLGWRMRENP
jgi:hypothetical protein